MSTAAKTTAKPAAKKAPAKPAAKTAAKPAAKKTAPKADADAEDLLGGSDKAPAKAEKAAKAPAKAEKAPKEKRVKEKVTFEDGEKDGLIKKVRATLAKAKDRKMNSKELAEKVGVATRKLRVVLYAMSRKEEVNLALGGSRVLGMTVTLPKAA